MKEVSEKKRRNKNRSFFPPAAVQCFREQNLSSLQFKCTGVFQLYVYGMTCRRIDK
jgi:hypothetical protein